jgi:hypothetical protein
MSFDCKVRCSNFIACNRAKPCRQGSSSLSPPRVLEYSWKIVGIDFVTDLPKSLKSNFIALLILVCHLTKMAHFDPCNKEITVEETTDIFIDHC